MKKSLIILACLVILSPLLANKTQAMSLSGVDWNNILVYGSASLIKYGKERSNIEKSIRFKRPSIKSYKNKNLVSQQKNLKKRLGITDLRQKRTSLKKYRLVKERPIRRRSRLEQGGSSYKQKRRNEGRRDFTDLEVMSKAYWGRKTNAFDRTRYNFLKTTTRP